MIILMYTVLNRVTVPINSEEMKPNGREQNNNAQSRPTEPNALKQ